MREEGILGGRLTGRRILNLKIPIGVIFRKSELFIIFKM